MKRILSLLIAVLTAAVFFTACHQEDKPLTLDQTDLSLVVGESAELSAGKAAKVHWSSSDETVAAVNNGKVSAKKPGAAVITASTEDGQSASCTVTVTDKLIEAITLNPTGARVAVGKTIQITAAYTPADASDVRLRWSSNSETIAAVDENGYVTGISEGVATITCQSSNGIQAACIVSVGGMQAPTVAPTQPPTVVPTETTAPTAAPQSTAGSGQTPSASGSSGMLFPDSSVSYLTAEQISARFNSMSTAPVSQSYAQDAVNEIFARHGYAFSTPEIRAYYEAQSWYHADPGYDGTLNDVEQYNIVLLSSY